ncbi:MAG: glyoxalase/bleomycin resistance/extradiol dioxygenase family protein [Symbiobacteriaceae bacterium]|jgi:predicted lactoylglutathione lyase|nr:glyoxalase/bleomycin resistance/extradiol dioxygenase family protein [Symbiobacteriaceae bacterium]
MARQIYVNLAVENVQRSQEFYTALGFRVEPKFTNEQAASMVIEENSIYVMLLGKEFFATFTNRELCDATKATEVLNCLSCESRQEVDDLVAKAVAAGGSTFRPTQDLGFMYAHAFADPDGHIWELAFMDMSAMQG